jgi:quercetin dioxygenase-like cupin family protein
MNLSSLLPRIVALVLPFAAASSSVGPTDAAEHGSAAAVQATGLILQAGEGERRVRRPRAAGVPGLPDPFILKVDRRNGGSQDLVMGYEELPPGRTIRPHRHLVADEIIFIHKGSALVSLGDREAQVGAGGTVYIPRNTRIGLRNTGSEPLGIVFLFSKPGFEELMRENSALEGETPTPISAAEQAQIGARNHWHTIHE